MSGFTLSPAVKLGMIGLLVLLLWAPAGLVLSLVQERAQRRDQVVAEVSRSWGNEQRVLGPVLSVPFDVQEELQTEKGVETRTVQIWVHLLPASLAVNGDLLPEVRSRAIYEVVLYSARLALHGTFVVPAFVELEGSPHVAHWDRAVVSLQVSDLRGIREVPRLRFGEREIGFGPAAAGGPLAGALAAPVPLDGPPLGAIPFSFDLVLNGSGQLSLLPLGADTVAELSSPWSSPSFAGAFLPETRSVSDKGFTARWRVLQLNRDYPQQWTERHRQPSDLWQAVERSAFGVRLLFPADAYQRTSRSVKYSVLFTLLTLVGFFVVEYTSRRPIHPVQYLLVGCGLCLFYLLLLSLSELITFDLAYLVAAAAIVGLVTAYARAVLGRAALAASAAGVLVLVYASLFLMLQLEELALLVGTLILLVVLATLMALTRRLNVKEIS